MVILFIGVLVASFLMLSAEVYKKNKPLTIRDVILGKGERFYSRLATALSGIMVVMVLILVMLGREVSNVRFTYINVAIFVGKAISINREESDVKLERGESLYKVLTSEGTYEILVKDRIKSDLTFDYEIVE